MIGCSSTPWITDCDAVDEADWTEKEHERRHRYSKGRVCPLCGEPMTNNAKTCIDCLPLQMHDPILTAERQRRRAERLREQVKAAPEKAATILATKLGEWPKLAARLALVKIRREKRQW